MQCMRKYDARPITWADDKHELGDIIINVQERSTLDGKNFRWNLATCDDKLQRTARTLNSLGSEILDRIWLYRDNRQKRTVVTPNTYVIKCGKSKEKILKRKNDKDSNTW